MKKFDIKGSLKDNRVKYGSFSVILTVMVLIAFIVVNLIFDQINVSKDLTKNKLFSLSDQSVKLLKNLNNNVTIIGLYESGKENKEVTEIINKYKSQSSKINVEYKDPVANPQLLQKYQKDGSNISINSIIVEEGSKYKVIAPSDMTTTSDSSTDDTSGLDGSSTTYITIEQKVSAAIMFVNSDKNSVIYELKGHSEVVPAQNIETLMSNQNYTTKEVNLLENSDWKPNSGDILFVYNPQTDMTEKEKTTISDFLSKGGKALFIMGYTKNNLPNFDDVFSKYGVQVQRNTIIEEDPQKIIGGNYKNILMPTMNSHDITTPLIASRVPVLMPDSLPIKENKVKKSTITVTPLLTTSSKAWAKKDMTSEGTEKTTSDYPGPFDVAVAITDKLDAVNEDNNTKIVVLSSGTMLSSDYLQYSSGASTMFINSFNYLQNQKNNINIAPKSVNGDSIVINALQQNLILVFCIIMIPAIILITGLVVWLRRKNL